MILHVAGLDKFIPPFIDLVNEECHNKVHKFWLYGDLEKYPLNDRGNVYVAGSSKLQKVWAALYLVVLLHRSRIVILHGLFSPNVNLILAVCPWLLKKCKWAIWGGDLYRYQQPTEGWVQQLNESVRRFIIPRVAGLITYIDGDVELARKWYGAAGKYHECLMYLSNVVNANMAKLPEKPAGQKSFHILLGNSADPSNNHLDALQRLIPYKDQDIKIFVPLSYGDRDHAQLVMSKGNEWFGRKFIPLLEFMPFNEYRELLKGLDIAIFNHQRQQAMGNIITLLEMGKTVFMRSDVSQWHFLIGLGVIINKIAQLNSTVALSALPIDNKAARENSQIIQSYFTKEKLVNQLSEIFEE